MPPPHYDFLIKVELLIYSTPRTIANISAFFSFFLLAILVCATPSF